MTPQMAPRPRPVAERLEGKYIPEPNSGCWIWLATVKDNGYATIGAGGKYGGAVYAHRVSYIAHKGPIPEGLELDHLCRVRCCINPDHLEAVTASENQRRGINPDRLRKKYAAITKCRNGHDLVGYNLMLVRKGACFKKRCRICERKRDREYKRARRAECSTAAISGEKTSG